MTAEAVSLTGEPNELLMEFMQLPLIQEIQETTLDDSRLQFVCVSEAMPSLLRDRPPKKG